MPVKILFLIWETINAATMGIGHELMISLSNELYNKGPWKRAENSVLMFNCWTIR